MMTLKCSYKVKQMEKWQIVMMRVREYFRKNEQTNWGKNQIITKLDEMEQKILEEEKHDTN